jgi:hypothetical protein
MASQLQNNAVAIGTATAAVLSCPAGATIAVTDLAFYNPTAGAGDFTLSIYRQASGTTTLLRSAQTLASKADYRHSGKFFLTPGDELRASSSAAGVVVATVMYALVSGAKAIARSIQGRGTWSSTATYGLNDVVDDGATSYLSLADGNLNQVPSTSTAWWMVHARRGLPGQDSTVPGPAPTLNTGTTTTGAAGSSATLTLTQTATGVYRVDATIPRGNTGATGTGDVTGPTASSEGELVLFTGTTGKVVKRSSTVPSSYMLGLMATTSLSALQTALGAGTASGLATLDATQKVPLSQLPEAVLGTMKFKGFWNASTNNPALPTPAAANTGWYYIVQTAGTTSLSGPNGAVTDWQVGDWAVSDGTYWDKIDSSDQVTAVAGLQGNITVSALKAALAYVVNDIGGLVSALAALAALASPIFTGRVTVPGITRAVAAKGSVTSGTVTFDATQNSAFTITNGGAQTWAFNWGSGYGEFEVIATNAGSAAITLPSGILWLVGDGTTSTTFSSQNVTLQASGVNHFLFWTPDGGTTVYGRAG